MSVKRMRSKAACWVVLGWALVWLVVIAPGHRRGLISTDAQPTSGLAAVVYKCPLCVLGGPTGDGEPADGPREDPVKTCALCKLNATLTPPPPPVGPAMVAERVALMGVVTTAPVVGLSEPGTCDARGPPAFA
ncbi:MAG: hypothetical protein AAF823_12225 [Planctomycetota bacterium]